MDRYAEVAYLLAEEIGGKGLEEKKIQEEMQSEENLLISMSLVSKGFQRIGGCFYEIKTGIIQQKNSDP